MSGGQSAGITWDDVVALALPRAGGQLVSEPIEDAWVERPPPNLVDAWRAKRAYSL